MSGAPFTPEQLAARARELRADGFVLSPIEPYFCTPETTAHLLLVKPRTLKQWRVVGRGPEPFDQHGRVLYRLVDVLAFTNGLEGTF